MTDITLPYLQENQKMTWIELFFPFQHADCENRPVSLSWDVFRSSKTWYHYSQGRVCLWLVQGPNTPDTRTMLSQSTMIKTETFCKLGRVTFESDECD